MIGKRKRYTFFAWSLRLALTCLCLRFFSVACAQDYVVSFRHWDMADGLSHRQVNTGVVDQQGFLWLGTLYGIDRFDGYSFRHFNMENAGLPFNVVRELLIDARGMIWARGDPAGNNICILNPVTGRAHTLKTPLQQPVVVMHRRRDGRILLETTSETNRWLLSLGDSALQPLPFHAPRTYRTAYFTSKDAIWLNANDTDMYELSPDGAMFRWVLPPGLGNQLYEFRSGSTEAFVAAPQTRDLYRIDEDRRVSRVPYVPPPTPEKIDNIINSGVDSIIFRQGRLYHPRLGLLRDFPAEGWDDLEGSVRMGFARAPGDIWIGGSLGLYHITIRRSLFRKYFFDAGVKQISENGYRGLLIHKGKLIGAQDKSGVFSQDLITRDSQVIHSWMKDNSCRFTTLLRLSDSSIVFASHQKLHKVDKDLRNEQLLGATGEHVVWCIYEWSRDSLLLGTDEGLAWFDCKIARMATFTGYNGYSGLRQSLVNSIKPQNADTLWLCAGNGLYTLARHGGITGRYSAADGGNRHLPASTFFECLDDGNGRYWLSTASGLVYWDRRRSSSRRYSTKDGLSNDIIHATYDDGMGRLWLSSDYGLMCFNKSTAQVVTYLTEDGTTSNEFDRISHLRGDDGMLYFGSINGVTAFNPKTFGTGSPKGFSHEPSTLAIASFYQFDGSRNELVDRTEQLIRTHHIVLHPLDRFLALELALLNYMDPGYTTYYWMIEGVDKKWNMQHGRTIRLSSVPFGHYKLRMRARAGNGMDGANELVVDLDVPAPFYRTAAFIITVALALVLATAFIFYRRNRRVLMENKRLEEEVALRTGSLRESLLQKEVLLKETHHRVKNNLQVISSLLSLQAQQVEDDAARQALQEGQNRVQSIAMVHQKLYQQDQVEAIVLATFTTDLFAQLSIVFDARRVQFINKLPEVLFNVNTAVPLGLILNELFTNSFKYAFTDTLHPVITVSMDTRDGTYSLYYHDNGSGWIGNSKNRGSLGTDLVHILARQLQGSATFFGDNGTTIVITFRA